VTDPRYRLDQPRSPRRGPRLRVDPEAFGRLTERIARFLGTGRYLAVQSIVVVVWIIWNSAAPHSLQFDPWRGTRFIFLTLVLSLQASYAAPLILLAQNRQDDRDRVNLEADRDEARESKADLDYLAREMAAIRMALGEVATRDFVRSELARIEDARERDARDAGEKARRKAKLARADAREARAEARELQAEARELQQALEAQTDAANPGSDSDRET